MRKKKCVLIASLLAFFSGVYVYTSFNSIHNEVYAVLHVDGSVEKERQFSFDEFQAFQKIAGNNASGFINAVFESTPDFQGGRVALKKPDGLAKPLADHAVEIMKYADIELAFSTTNGKIDSFDGEYDVRLCRGKKISKLYLAVPRYKARNFSGVSFYFGGEEYSFSAKELLPVKDFHSRLVSSRIMKLAVGKEPENKMIAWIDRTMSDPELDWFEVPFGRSTSMLPFFGQYVNSKSGVNLLVPYTRYIVIFAAVAAIVFLALNKIRRMGIPFRRVRCDNFSLFVIVVGVGMLCAVIFHFIFGAYSAKYPMDTFLFQESVRFTDFTDMLKISGNFSPYQGAGSYFPFAYVVFAMFAVFPKLAAVAVFLVGSAVLMFLLVKSFLNAFKERKNFFPAVLLLSIGTYPFLFCLDRGNIELVVFLLVAFSIFLYRQGKTGASASLIALAGAMKLFPLFFLLLFLKERRYKEIFLALSVFFTVMVFSFMLFDGSIGSQLRMMITNQQSYSDIYYKGIHEYSADMPDSITFCGLSHGHSIFGVVRILLIKTGLSTPAAVDAALSIHMAAVLGILFLAVLFVMLIEKERWKIVALLVMLVDLLPNVSADYKLLYVLIPALLLLLEGEGRHLRTYVVLFGLLLVPKSYYYFSSIITDSGASDASIASFINPALMTVVVLLIAVQGAARISLREVLGNVRDFFLGVKENAVYVALSFSLVIFVASALWFVL